MRGHQNRMHVCYGVRRSRVVAVRGGLVFFRGGGAEARAYLESDHSHADDYYLEGGGALAEWSAFDENGQLIDSDRLDGDAYQAWVNWEDPRTGEVRGTIREEVRVSESGEIRVSQASPRFVEMTVNCDKSLSVAAALSPEVSAALDAAQAAAVDAMNGYMSANSVTRVGARGEQRFVRAERLESVAVTHRTSRAGDPHRHVHVQWSTRVFAEGKWRSLHTGATLKQQGALRGVGEAAINSHTGLQWALAHAGFEFDAQTGRVTNLTEQSRVLSKRASQVQANVARLEAQWRQENPGREPDRRLQLQWNQQAWALDRPRKATANLTGEAAWIDELRTAGLQVDGFGSSLPAARLRLADLDTEVLFDHAVTTAAARGSAWSIADLEGHLGVAVGAAGVDAAPAEITAFVASRARELAARLPQLDVEVNGQLPAWVRHLTSERVLRVEEELRATFTRRGLQSGLVVDETPIGTLNAEQSAAARALASSAPLVVIEGAAGAGKTTMLAVGRELAAAEGRELVVVAPTKRAASEAATALGAQTSSAHQLVYEHGYRWDKDGRWWRLQPGQVDTTRGVDENGRPIVYQGPNERYQLHAGVRIVVDEAGMIDQDLAHALMTVANESASPVALIGDRAQLPAVGRGGVLDMAVAASPRPLDLSELHRFADKEYAQLTIAMRDRAEPGVLFDKLHARGNITIHASEATLNAHLADDVVKRALAGASVAVAVSSNEAADALNALVQDARARAGHTRTPATSVAGADGRVLRIGDRIMTRRNNTDLEVDNRDTWTVTKVHRDGSVTVVDDAKSRTLPRAYVEEHTHLAYAATTYGVQGATVDVGHAVLSDATTAQSLYVAATRGRVDNSIHVTAADVDEARTLFAAALERDSGDRGVENAKRGIYRDVDGIHLSGRTAEVAEAEAAAVDVADAAEVDAAPAVDHQVRAQRLAAQERVYKARVREYELARDNWQKRHPDELVDRYADALTGAADELATATQVRTEAEAAHVAAVLDRHQHTWSEDYAAVDAARAAAADAGPFRRRQAEDAVRDATRSFEQRHGAAPTRVIPPHIEKDWHRSALEAGSSPDVDHARARVQAAQDRLARLQADPAPTPPAQVRPGTEAEEAARDARFAQRAARRQVERRGLEREQAEPQLRPGGPQGLER